MLKYIDIHSHLNFKAFDENWQAVIKRALDNNTWMINVGTQVDTSKKAVEIAHQYKEGVYAIIGLHPIHTDISYHNEEELGETGKEFTSRGEIFDKNVYLELLKDPKVLAIGECGLDYFHMEAGSIEKQKKAFIEQIELANEINKPLMLHIRNNPKDKKIDAYVDVLEILKKYSKVKGNVHFFAGSIENAKDFLNYGFTLSFTGVITFTHDYDEIIKNTPLDMIMSETDSPYVAPVPYRGKRNEPSYVKEVVKKIALIKNLPEEEITKAIIANAKRVFRI
ncbi:MAG: Hydrolase, TatD family [Candidatus Nomurabacteria bacterium GW2011_GWF2_35_12]|uniref:Hydrolase, TatD family n=2 Tax=Candidatus Nomuraibacteriota TaxID=1752729 RepID=A0A0G0E8Q3_9BACT|nr:MAG: Hydrolase, TatD family [Candidatus Nomurabacteria bacterium GW2011_GWF2_35_12]KKP85148.1 MAG: Hydrolase, TatD family [Parcubacteria group bacterium GW2011_GWD2_35_7]KKP97491.1 MAG: Hydrolase, TatD family [Candidatus Nomurabacteria bacterium GW2011_GWA1_36_15]HCY18094.1 hydrolase TatD [Candidatus Nomurabacteria bacterium]